MEHPSTLAGAPRPPRVSSRAPPDLRQSLSELTQSSREAPSATRASQSNFWGGGQVPSSTAPAHNVKPKRIHQRQPTLAQNAEPDPADEVDPADEPEIASLAAARTLSSTRAGAVVTRTPSKNCFPHGILKSHRRPTTPKSCSLGLTPLNVTPISIR